MSPLYYSALYTDGIHPAARFPRERYRRVHDELLRRGQAARIRLAPRVRREDLLLAHAPGYVDAFFAGTLDPAVQRRIGLRPWTPDILERTERILGGTLAATRDVLHGGAATAGNLAGGTHHAHYDFGSGFCVFNDLAVAARWALGEGVRQVLIVDLDVHQGDGTAALFAGEPRVFTFSIHCKVNFPFRKQASDLDVELPAAAGDAAYLAALDEHWPGLLDALRPDLVLLQAGVDPLEADTLGKLRLTRAGLAARNARVLEAVAARQIPLVVTLGGGYAEPIDATAEAAADVFAALS